MADAAGSAEQPSPQLDTTTPSLARAYDALLGGKDNFDVDRQLVSKVRRFFPDAPLMALENRRWLVRAVRFLTRMAGIDQFLDCGSGLLTVENTHEVAHRINPEASVVYVDKDPACLALGRALLSDNDRTHFVHADLTRPDDLLAHPTVTKHLDFDRPLALLQCATMHHVSQRQRPYAIMQSYIHALPPGSYLALTHFWDPQDACGHYTNLARGLEQCFRDGGLSSVFSRTTEVIASYFDGLEMLPSAPVDQPALTRLREWWPDGPPGPRTDADELVLGGLARKP